MKPACHRESPVLRRVFVGVLLAGGAAFGATAAPGVESATVPARAQDFSAGAVPIRVQGSGPAVEAAPAAPAMAPGQAPAAETEAPPRPVKMTAGSEVVRVFVEACVDHGGAVAPAVDWALNHGFEPLDPEGRDGTDGHALLGGQPGVVFATPEAATRVLLAVTQDHTCTVWAERAGGKGTQDAFVQAAEAMGARGALVRRETDRTLERAGAWRRQLEYRLRSAPDSPDYRLGAVTTLTDSPAAQALHLAPVQSSRAAAPAEVRPVEAVTPVVGR